jgi:hypothetical protein
VARKLAICAGLGVLGLAIGCGIVFFAVSRWTSLDSRWIESGFVGPLILLLLALAFVAPTGDPERGALRRALIPVAALLSMTGNYLAFVITSHVWYADRMPVGRRSLFYQLLHPGVLPTYVERSYPSGVSAGLSWVEQVVLGFVIGGIAFWWISRWMSYDRAAARQQG